jgi:hypothetical protein
VHAALGHGFPPAGFVESCGLLGYVQSVHRNSRKETSLELHFFYYTPGRDGQVRRCARFVRDDVRQSMQGSV